VSTLRTSEPRFRRLIDAIAEYVALPSWEIHGERFVAGEVLEALILQESGGLPAARRYEPHHDAPGRRDSAEDADTPNLDDGLLEDDASYGLMQVLGSNVRRLVGAHARPCEACGLREPGGLNFGFLLRPLTGMAFGLRVLLEELDLTDGSWSRSLARYNGGPSGESVQPDGKMRRQIYVDEVERKCVIVREDRKDAGWIR